MKHTIFKPKEELGALTWNNEESVTGSGLKEERLFQAVDSLEMYNDMAVSTA